MTEKKRARVLPTRDYMTQVLGLDSSGQPLFNTLDSLPEVTEEDVKKQIRGFGYAPPARLPLWSELNELSGLSYKEANEYTYPAENYRLGNGEFLSIRQVTSDTIKIEFSNREPVYLPFDGNFAVIRDLVGLIMGWMSVSQEPRPPELPTEQPAKPSTRTRGHARKINI